MKKLEEVRKMTECEDPEHTSPHDIQVTARQAQLTLKQPQDWQHGPSPVNGSEEATLKRVGGAETPWRTNP